MAFNSSALRQAAIQARHDHERARTAQPANADKAKSARKVESPAKTLPQSIEAEQGILGSMLVDPAGAIAEARRLVNENYFYVPAHRSIFVALCDMWDSGVQVDLITFTQFLRDRKLLEQVGGVGFVTELFTFVSTAANLSFYVDIVREKLVLREMIAVGNQMARASYGDSENVLDLVAGFGQKIERIKQSAGGPNGVHELTVEQLRGMKGVPDKNALVGNRWLVRGGNCLWAGGAGYGKSSLTMQLAVYWACGHAWAGLRPHFPLKSLIIQAENDDFDMAEQYNGVIEGIATSGALDVEAQREMIDKNVIVLRMEGVSGYAFLSKLGDLLGLYRPALVWIDPLFSFAGCDLLDAEKTGRFLREGLFPLFTKHSCCGQVIHHVGKPPRAQDNVDRSTLDEQYLSFGTSEIQNAFRAVNILKPPTKATPAFRLVLSKRGERSRAKTLDGEPTHTIFLEHAHPNICWIQVAEPEKPAAGKSATKYDGTDILEEMSIIEGMEVGELQKHVASQTGMSRAAFYRHWKDLKSAGKVRVDSDGKWFPKRLNPVS